MRLVHLALFVLITACGGASSKPPARPLGVTDHLVEAQRHDADAAVHEAIADEAARRARSSVPYVCGDRVLGDQVSSGGERLGASAPCWTAESSAIERHRAEAARLRADAGEHRHRAAELLAAERASCAGLGADDLDLTAFAHREDVVAVSAEVEAGVLRGARIQFRRLEGLDADWLRQSIACHRARAAAIGWDSKYMSYDPSALDGVKVMVSNEPDGVVVVIRATDDQVAEVTYRRAEDLLDPPSGPR